MKTIQINVGLNNNPLTAGEVADYFAMKKDYRLMMYYYKDMTFKGVVEPTFIALLEYTEVSQSTILQDFEEICSDLNQESIAIKTDKMSALAFNCNYIGESYSFDEQYFESSILVDTILKYF